MGLRVLENLLKILCPLCENPENRGVLSSEVLVVDVLSAEDLDEMGDFLTDKMFFLFSKLFQTHLAFVKDLLCITFCMFLQSFPISFEG